jgi:general secretion pathway protein B
MSYILDALRRADQQRQRHAAPTLLTLQPSAVVRKRPASLVYILLAAILIGAGIVIGWLRPWQTPPAARTEAVVVKPVESAPPQQAPAPSIAASQPNQDANVSSGAPPVQSTATASEVAAAAKPDTATQSAPQATQLPPAITTAMGSTPKSKAVVPAHEGHAPLPSDRLAYTPAADAPEQPVIAMADLPPAVRQEIPAMTISVHAWSSNPAASMIGINYKLLHEGDQVAAGLKLEQITQEGAVFTYKGYRFSRGLK